MFAVGCVLLDKELPIPAYAHTGDAGMDLYAAEDCVIQPGDRKLVRTGICFQIPEGYAGFVHPRSGLAHKYGISIVNAPGTIDSGYRGEIYVNLINLDSEDSFLIRKGDRIAQIVFQRVERAIFVEVAALDESSRGTGGHGSTGV